MDLSVEELICGMGSGDICGDFLALNMKSFFFK